jgi:hypothetical protein
MRWQPKLPHATSAPRLAAICVAYLVTLAAGIFLGTNLAESFYPAQRTDDVGQVATTRTALNTKDISVVFALGSECVYCEKSMDFYRPFLEALRSAGIRTVALFDEPLAVASQYAKVNSLAFDAISRVDFSQSGVLGTPTIFVLDKDGGEIGSWKGLITSKERRELVQLLGLTKAYALVDRRIADSAYEKRPIPMTVVTGDWLYSALLENAAVLIDTRSRTLFRQNHALHSINMPLDELSELAKSELDKTKTIVLFCDYEPECSDSEDMEISTTYCKLSTALLIDLGFNDVRVITKLDLSLSHLRFLPSSGERSVSLPWKSSDSVVSRQ